MPAVAGRARRRARCWSRLSVALGVALVTHSSVDPSFTTAAGGPPTNWLGSFGAYSSDVLLFLFGPAAALFLPLIALAGLRMVRGSSRRAHGRAAGRGARRRAGRDRARPIAARRCLACPRGWGGALGLAGAYGVDAAVGLVGNPASRARCAWR